MIIQLVSLVDEAPLELLKIYEGQFVEKIEEIHFRPTTATSYYHDKYAHMRTFYTKNPAYEINKLGWFAANKFITLAEFREKQINKILE
jgi:hypothetical protein